jgi:hypothetical protein
MSLCDLWFISSHPQQVHLTYQWSMSPTCHGNNDLLHLLSWQGFLVIVLFSYCGVGKTRGDKSPAAHLPLLHLLRSWCGEMVLVVCCGAVWGK